MKHRDRTAIHFYTPNDIEGIEVVRGNNVAHNFTRHVHSTYCIGVVEKGTRVIERGQKTTIIPENGMFVLNPGEAHHCKSGDDAGHSYGVICPKPFVMNSVASQISGIKVPAPYFKDVHIPDTDLVKRVRRFVVETADAHLELERDVALMGILSDLIIKHSDVAPSVCYIETQKTAIDRATSYIESNYSENLTLNQLAHVACLSPFHFQRVFLKERGVSPHEYLIKCRIKKGGDLLLSGKRISEVALETGFSDQSHFTRFFKRAMGVPPGVYAGNKKS